MNKQIRYGNNGVPLEFLGKVEIPYARENIERIIAGSRVSIGELEDTVKKYHIREPATNITGTSGFLDFVRNRRECDLYNTAVYKGRRQGIFKEMLKFLAEIGTQREIVSIYIAVSRDNIPMLHAIEKYGFKRTGNREHFLTFKVDISSLDI